MIKINCRNPIFVNNVVVPCGKCFSCRKKFRTHWQLRLQHEYLSYDGCAMFLTLTYNEENYPDNNSLVKRDVQLFLKRLRKHYHDVKIRYFAVGEYGDKKHRPHYHLIIFGLRAPELKKHSVLNFNYGLFLAEHIWKKGFCHVGYVNSKCIAYVSKYVLKNFIKGKSRDDYLAAGMEPPFSLKSSGIGLQWLLCHVDVVVNDIKQEKSVKLYKSRTSYPRYYRKKLIDLGYFPEDYFSKKYYKEMDNLQSSIIHELRENHINLGSENYLDISISEFYNIDTSKKFIPVPTTINLPRRYKTDFHVNKFIEVPRYSDEEINDILEKHWFIIYKNFCKSKNDINEKIYKEKHSNMVSEYE